MGRELELQDNGLDNALAGEHPRRHLGQMLIDAGLLSEDQLRIALLEQLKQETENGRPPIGKLLVKLGFVTEAALRDALAENLGQTSVDLKTVVPDAEALAILPRELALRHHVFPVSYDRASKQMVIAVADPGNVVVLDRVRAILPVGATIATLLSVESEVLEAIDAYYGYELSIDGILHEIETGVVDWQAVDRDDYSQPVVRLVNAILIDAVKREASDIHFEPEANFLRIRYRIDGILSQIRSLHKSYWPAIVVRIKVLSGMNIAEVRAPQDGHIGITVSGRKVDFRAACQPTIHGENVVLRVLDRQKSIAPLDALGLEEECLDLLRLMIARPEGILLVTGPTGSGKTTTLYSVLNHINSESIHIMTLEDPVEYPMPLVRQTSVSEATKLDFANGIRSMMRQDPDVILVGEIRDKETAEMAFRAAMTGHQVYSTLHTNSALGAIPRLLDIGIRPGILAGNIIGIIAQRLVRRLCEHCKQPYLPSDMERRLLGLTGEDEAPTLYAPGQCNRCNMQGYKGRLALMEVLRFDRRIDELIADEAPLHEIHTLIQQRGFRSLAEDGLRRVYEGITSVDEVGRVVDLTERMLG